MDGLQRRREEEEGISHSMVYLTVWLVSQYGLCHCGLSHSVVVSRCGISHSVVYLNVLFVSQYGLSLCGLSHGLSHGVVYLMVWFVSQCGLCQGVACAMA